MLIIMTITVDLVDLVITVEETTAEETTVEETLAVAILAAATSKAGPKL